MTTPNIPSKIAFIESNTTGSGEEFIKSALKNNLEVLFISANPAKYKFLSQLLIRPIVLDTANLEIIYAYLKDIPQVVAVLSTSELFIYTASQVAKLLHLPHNDLKAIQRCRNKYMCNELIAKNQLPYIKTELIDFSSSYNNINELLKNFTFPVIIKPNSGTGSIGVKLCYSFQEVIEHINSLSGDRFCCKQLLIQEYLDGEEFSIEIIAVSKHQYHLLGITKKYLGPKPYFVEVAHEFPAPLNKFLQDKIYSCVKKALDAIGFSLGAIHIEFRLVDDKVYIIEINPRLAGGMIPILIEQSQGIKLVDNLIYLFMGQNISFDPKTFLYTKIAFFLPNQEGKLKQILGVDSANKIKNIVCIDFNKNLGDILKLNHDFTDRLGFIIAKSNTIDACRKAITDAYQNISFEITPLNDGLEERDYPESYARARLSNQQSDPQIKHILKFNFYKSLSDIKFISDINKAHVIMLQRCGIMSLDSTSQILTAITKLEKEDFCLVKQFEAEGIGSYLAYEQSLIKMLGIEIAGNVHIGRSRNDINATVMRLKSRSIFINLYFAIWQIRAELLQIATNSLDIVMPVYSQYQPAMPGTYAYYLVSIESTLAYYQAQLKQTLSTLNTYTMGAASGAGTSFPIDIAITNEFLGFSNLMSSALSTVSNRTLELTMLSIGSMLGVTISRIAQDYQIWTTQEFAFFSIPDRFCGISSAMPQKKNPYLLEKIKGKAVSMTGTLINAIVGMQKTPFANSVEIGTESLIGYENAFNELIKAIKLLQLIIQNAQVLEKNMLRSNINGLTAATNIAESMVKERACSYRESHQKIGECIARAIKNKLDPLQAITKQFNFKLKPNEWHLSLEYGNGPGTDSINMMLKEANSVLDVDALFFYSTLNKWDEANQLLTEAVNNLLK